MSDVDRATRAFEQFIEARKVPKSVAQQLSDDPDPAARLVLADLAEEQGLVDVAEALREGDGPKARIRAGAIGHPAEAHICADLAGAKGWEIP